jgi:hypothetical protein
MEPRKSAQGFLVQNDLENDNDDPFSTDDPETIELYRERLMEFCRVSEMRRKIIYGK